LTNELRAVEQLKNNTERAIAILTPLFVKAQEADSPDEEQLGGALDVLTGWFGQNGQPLRRLDQLEAEIGHLRADYSTLYNTARVAILEPTFRNLEALRALVEQQPDDRTTQDQP